MTKTTTTITTTITTTLMGFDTIEINLFFIYFGESADKVNNFIYCFCFCLWRRAALFIENKTKWQGGEVDVDNGHIYVH